VPAIAEPVNKPPRSGSPDAAKFDYIASTIRKSLGVNTIDRMSPQIYLRTTMTEQKAYNVGPSHIDIAYERFGEGVDLHANGVKTLVLPVPGAHFRVEVNVTPTFRPRELSPQTETDNRDLGAKITYTYLPPRKAAHR